MSPLGARANRGGWSALRPVLIILLLAACFCLDGQVLRQSFNTPGIQARPFPLPAPSHFLQSSGAIHAGNQPLTRLTGRLVVRPREPGRAAELVQGARNREPELAGWHVSRPIGKGLYQIDAPEHIRLAHQSDPSLLDSALAAARKSPEFATADPVFLEASGLRLICTRDLIVALRQGVDPEAYFGPDWARARTLRGAPRQFILSCADRTAEQLLLDAARHAADERVEWAEPNFISEARRPASDPLYGEQWHLENTGQSGGKSSADAGVEAAWAAGSRGQGTVIAVVDDGIQLQHPDLIPNAFTNLAETLNGIDDDSNGYIDDVSGWDFVDANNDPRPKHSLDVHGTSVAGVAAAAANNGLGGSGVAPEARLLPAKVLTGDFGISYDQFAEAIRYVAGLTTPQPWRGADVIVVSLIFGSSAVVNSALTDAATQGRAGLGCPIFVASGNAASGYVFYELLDIPPGTYFFEWTYVKDVSAIDGEDTCRVADILFPDGSHERFDSAAVPAGWNMAPYGGSAWMIEDNPARAFGTGRYQARAGPIGHLDSTDMRSPSLTTHAVSSISFSYWISSEFRYDFIELWVRDLDALEWLGPFLNDSGEYPFQADTSYPANHPDTIAVGASTDFDYRSHYSQYGSMLDFLAPSDGGRGAILTTDLQGAEGSVPTDYYPAFGGTSASAPLAAGIGALMLSANPHLTAAEVRSRLRRTADPIGAVTYVDGRNPFYGSGRVNAARAVSSVRPPQLHALGWTNGIFYLRASGLPGTGAAILERGPDLNTWIPVSTNLIEGSELELSHDTGLPQAGGWYYRLRLP